MAKKVTFFCLGLLLTCVSAFGGQPSKLALETADHALRKNSDAAVALLAKLVAFPTVHEEGKNNQDLPAFKEMGTFLKKESERLGLDFADRGGAWVIGLGKGTDRLGLITHGDVQPAEAVKWAKGPFTLDDQTEPGKLIARGSEDDKGPIAIAMYAMRSILEMKVPLQRRIELIVSLHEESDWDPFTEFLAKYPAPEVNIGLDAEYPVVVAEKGWCSIHVRFPETSKLQTSGPILREFQGGQFMSQVPEDGHALIEQVTPALVTKLRRAAKKYRGIEFVFTAETPDKLRIDAKGLSAHSSTPDKGRNALTHLAALLGKEKWPPTAASEAVRFINDLIGLDLYGKKFGKIAYKDSFMGPLTTSLSLVHLKDGKLDVGVNLRRPLGRTKEKMETEIQEAIQTWKKKNPASEGIETELYIGEPHFQKDAPHVQTLLDVFGHYAKVKNPKPVSIGGGSQARLVPHGVNFGPGMPDEVYTGHSEHEFMTRAQLEMNLQMYTAALVELGTSEGPEAAFKRRIAECQERYKSGPDLHQCYISATFD